MEDVIYPTEQGVVYELCPLCEYEVKLLNELKVQTCPNCLMPIFPCAICIPDETDCSKCPLEDK